MHLALASDAQDDAFRPEQVMPHEAEELRKQLAEHAAGILQVLKSNFSRLPDDIVELCGNVIARRKEIRERFSGLNSLKSTIIRTRVHGDYHLGQVLRVKDDFVILDFEGEPARPLAERRKKQSPLKDVAGMLRSFNYAAYAAQKPEDPQIEDWAKLWISAVSEEFLHAYSSAPHGSPIVPEDANDFRLLLQAFVLDKVLYELGYELNNRPDWVKIPLNGILSLLS